MKKTIYGFKAETWEKYGKRRLYVNFLNDTKLAETYFDLDNGNKLISKSKHAAEIPTNFVELFFDHNFFSGDVRASIAANAGKPTLNELAEAELATKNELDPVSAEALREMGNAAVAWEQAEVRTSIRNEWNDGDDDEAWEA